MVVVGVVFALYLRVCALMRATYPTSRGLCTDVLTVLQCVALAGLGVGSNAALGVITVAIAGREATGV